MLSARSSHPSAPAPGQALTRSASKLRQSLPRVELQQAALLSAAFVCSDKKAGGLLPGPNIPTQKEKKGRRIEKKKGGGRGWGGKHGSAITGIVV